MGCFSACFGTMKKHKNTMKIQDQCLSPSHDALLAADGKSLKEEEEIVNPMKLNSESMFESEEQLNISNSEKIILNDTNIDTHMGRFEEKLVQNETGEVENKTEKCENDQDFLPCDKEQVVASKESALDDNKDFCFVQQESSDSLFSLSIDSRRQVYAVEMGEKEVSSPFKANEKETNSQLEDILKKNPPPLKYDEDKENNVDLEGKSVVKSLGDEIAVHSTSLSSWLVEQETKSPQGKSSIGNSPESEKNYGDRRVLGEINTQKVNKSNECLSAQSTPRCGVDDQPGIGSVGNRLYAAKRVARSGGESSKNCKHS